MTIDLQSFILLLAGIGECRSGGHSSGRWDCKSHLGYVCVCPVLNMFLSASLRGYSPAHGTGTRARTGNACHSSIACCLSSTPFLGVLVERQYRHMTGLRAGQFFATCDAYTSSLHDCLYKSVRDLIYSHCRKPYVNSLVQ